MKDLRRSLAPMTGLSPSDDSALLRTALPPGAPPPIAQTVKDRTQQLRNGYPKGLK